MKSKLLIATSSILLLAGCQLLPNSTQSNSKAPDATNSAIIETKPGVATTSEAVNYFDDVIGYYATPSDPGNYPGVVMIHEWWGLNNQIKDTADILASQGYQVLAVDLFNGSVATTPDQARAQTSSLDQEEALANLSAATKYLRDHGASKVASLGWCFGGGQSLQLSLSDEQLDGTIIYYGNLVTDQNELASIDGPVLGIFGAEDASISTDNVNSFESALNNLNIENSITIYPGVGHAFANPSGASYAPEPTQDAWNKTLEFLNKNLQS